MPDVRNGPTKTTRPDEMRSRWPHEEQDGLATFNTKTNLYEAFREFFDMPKILAPLTKLLPEPEKVHRRPYD